MKKLMEKFVVLIFITVFVVNCTPGRAQTRQNVKSQFDKEVMDEADSEEVINFDNDDYNDKINKKQAKKSKPIDDAETDEALNIIEDDNPISTPKKDKFYQTGVASWYGREFHNKTTASGEKFNMYALTAAHKTLPFGSIIRVKNLDNGKSVTVKINDRGPYRGNRIIDLSFSAAKKIGLISSGKTLVGLNILKSVDEKYTENEEAKEGIFNDNYFDKNDKEKRIEAVVEDTHEDNGIDESTSGNYSIQVGAFYSKRKAQYLKKRVETMTVKPVVVIQDGDFYKVRVEGINNTRELNNCKKKFSEEQISSYTINNKE